LCAEYLAGGSRAARSRSIRSGDRVEALALYTRLQDWHESWHESQEIWVHTVSWSYFRA